MTPDEERIDLTERLGEVERRLRSILELASNEVVGGATAEEKLEDAERRLNRIYDLAQGDESQP
ncbi:MAG: hypothetical protein ACRDG8_10635 [Actinomycetota bacterium]